MDREEAIEIIRKNMPSDKSLPVYEALRTLVPELAESEDERVRKEIINYILYKADGVSEEQEHSWIAYLEKQKEPHYTKRNALFDKCMENCDPKTVEEVDKRVDDIMNMPKFSPFEQALINFIGDWEDDEEHWPSQFVKKHGKHILDIAREELQKEQKPNNEVLEWARKNKARLNGVPIEEALSKMMVHKEPYIAPVPTPMVADEQKPAEWSEKDEKQIRQIERIVKEAGSSVKLQEQIHNWFESLRPSWRPSEEQMEALNILNLHGDLSYVGQQKQLISLYQDLKKLM